MDNYIENELEKTVEPEKVQEIVENVEPSQVNKKKKNKLREKPKAEPLYYSVAKDDSLILIAQKHNVTVGQIINLNRIKNPNMIYIGQVLRIK